VSIEPQEIQLRLLTFKRYTYHRVLVTNLDLTPVAVWRFYCHRGYMDFVRLYTFTEAWAFFITCAKKTPRFYRHSPHRVDRSAGARCDQTILLTGISTAQRYPDPLWRTSYFDAEKDSRLTFLAEPSQLRAY
jgi:hypothetical protein